MVAFLPADPLPASRLTIYIEGDGLAWTTPTLASSDPTPRDPLGLRLALAHPGGAAAYLARPCQYVDAEAIHCSRRYWTNARFASEVVTASDRAIDILKARFKATHLTLVGYSGGGAVATLLAALRRDVDILVTVAGNLDHQAWTDYQRISPLDGSLNPADKIAGLRGIKQWHFVGGKDDNLPPELAKGFARRFPPSERPVVMIEPEFDHRCCWAENWSRLAAVFQPE
jgi:dienelactone hydrolase